jgi:hypothetical protein
MSNANDTLKFLEGKGVDTSVGRVFLASDVEQAIKDADDTRLDNALAPKPKTMVQAKRMARQDKELMKQFEQVRRSDIAGSSISAGPES